MNIVRAAKNTFIDAVRLSWQLVRIMVPIIIVVKILKELGLISYLALPLSPIMEIVGLPAQTGLVWATALANTIYSGVLVYLALIPDMPPLTVAQVTVMCTMMLIGHNLPVEGRIAQKCGLSLWGQMAVRVGGALACGMLMHLVLSTWNLLNWPALMAWRGPTAIEVTWGQWAWGELRNLGMIFCVILTLMALMRVLNYLRITRLFQRILAPVLRLVGIGPEAATITIIGLTLGIAYGGGLIIHEAQSGRLKKADIFGSMSLMGLTHSIIEDTLIMTLLGASLYGILWGRLAFTLVGAAILTRLVARDWSWIGRFWRRIWNQVNETERRARH